MEAGGIVLWAHCSQYSSLIQQNLALFTHGLGSDVNLDAPWNTWNGRISCKDTFQGYDSLETRKNFGFLIDTRYQISYNFYNRERYYF